MAASAAAAAETEMPKPASYKTEGAHMEGATSGTKTSRGNPAADGLRYGLELPEFHEGVCAEKTKGTDLVPTRTIQGLTRVFKKDLPRKIFHPSWWTSTSLRCTLRASF